jgi:ATP-dependent Zn protease
MPNQNTNRGDERHAPPRIAIHEAGHAVSAHVLEIPLESCSIVHPVGGTASYNIEAKLDAIKSRGLGMQATAEAFRNVGRDCIAIALGGRIAEELFATEGVSGDQAYAGDEVDIEDLFYRLALGGPLRQRERAKIRTEEQERAARLLGENDAAVMAVAEQLARRKTLDAGELSEIIRTALKQARG